MVGVLFGTLSALCIGLSDLFGRRVVAASSATTTAAVMQLVAAVTSILMLAVIASSWRADDLLRGGLSGFGMAVGLACYYGGIARSSAAVVAPVTATLAAVIPFCYTVVTGTAPSPLAFGGAMVAFVGLVLITIGSDITTRVGLGMAWGLCSGLGYGFGLSVLVDTTSSSGSWPAVSQRLVAFVFLVAVAKANGVGVVPPVGTRVGAVAAGTFAGLASIFFLIGVQSDATEAVVTSSMFPAATVAIGRLFYGDSVGRLQALGVAVVVLGVAAVVGG